MKAYCVNCGSLLEFPAGKKPNFCFSCGANTTTGKITAHKPATESPQPKEKVSFDDEEEELSVPDISKLDFDIQGSLKVSKSSIGDIVSVSDGNEDSYIPTEIRTKGPRISKKKFMEQFKKEAGSLRKGVNG